MSIAAYSQGGAWLPNSPLFEGVAIGQDSSGVEAVLLRRIKAKFPYGADDKALVPFLKEQGFAVKRSVNQQNRSEPIRGRALMHATQPTGGKMRITVTWRADPSGRITEIKTWYGGAL